MMRDLPILIGLAGIVILMIVRWFMRASGGTLAVLRQAAFGARDRERPMDSIAAYSKATGAPDGAIDDRTWDDLDMDKIFATLDHTSSAIGQQVLYARLRSGRFDSDD